MVNDIHSVNNTVDEYSQTKWRGDNDSEYQIYKANAEAMGWTVKSYDEWLDS